MKEKLFWQLATIVAVIVLFTSPLKTVFAHLPSLITPVHAQEIYPMFTCPCCGEPLDKDNPCCDSMTEMIDYIDTAIDNGSTKDEVVLATTRQFGLERLANEADRQALRERFLASAPKNSPKITVSEVKRDLGVVSQKKGVVTTEFTIKNIGASDLVIDKMASSCGCTSASLVYKGVEGPRFYMPGHGHDAPDPNWKVAVAPQDTALVKVYYDPMVHPDLTGPVTREVTVHSNDPVDFETKFTITLDQEK